MISVKSQRAQGLVKNPKTVIPHLLDQMILFPGQEWKLSAHLELEGNIVKKMAFSSSALQDGEIVILEAIGQLISGKELSRLERLSFRECEAFLRDRNSEPALEGVDEVFENRFTALITWLRTLRSFGAGTEYEYDYSKGPFRNLKTTDRIKELKAFLNSSEVRSLYQGQTPPQLVDLDELTAYVSAPYSSDEQRALFEELHTLGVGVFHEDELNFIPES